MNKKRIYIIVGAMVVIIALVIVLILSTGKSSVSPFGDSDVVPYEPEFMDNLEKSAFSLPEDAKIQVLKRSEIGAVEVYKIIREDADIVTDLEEIK